MQGLVGKLLFHRQFLAARFLHGHEDLDLGQRKGQEAQVLQQPTPGGQGIRRRVGNGLIMDATAVGVAQKEDEEQRIDEQDIFDRVVLFLPAITVRLFNRVLGADDASFGPVMGTRGEAGAAAGPATTGAGASSSGTTTVAASASETQRRQQHGKEDVHPLVGFALAHPKHAPVDHLERRGLEVGQDKQQPGFGGRQGAVLRDGKPARGPRLPIQAPHRPPGLKRGREGQDHLLQLVEGHTGAIQALHRAGLQHGAPYTSHGWCLLSLSREVISASYHKAGYTQLCCGGNAEILCSHSLSITCDASCTPGCRIIMKAVPIWLWGPACRSHLHYDPWCCKNTDTAFPSTCAWWYGRSWVAGIMTTGWKSRPWNKGTRVITVQEERTWLGHLGQRHGSCIRSKSP